MAFIVVTLTAQMRPVRAQEEPGKIVEQYVRAAGGSKALGRIQTLIIEGAFLSEDGKAGTYTLDTKLPNRYYSELQLGEKNLIEAYNGKEGWKVSPFFGRKDPERMSADDAKALIEDAEIDGPLIDWKAKGSTVEYLGTEDVDGTLAHKLKVARKNGDVSFVYLDPDHFLEIRVVTQRLRHGAQEEVETDLGDYENAAGVFVPTSIESGRKGAPDKQRIIIDKVEANMPVDDAVFHFPAAK